MAQIQLPDPVDNCTVTDLVDAFPCLNCLSKTELIAVLAQSLALLDSKDLSGSDLTTLLNDSACIGCLSETQMLRAVVSVIGKWANRSMTVSAIRDDVKCLVCVDPGRVRALVVYLICVYIQNQQQV